MTKKFGGKKLETSAYRTVQKVFRYAETFMRDWRVWRTDGRTNRRTDIPIANAQLTTLRGQNCTWMSRSQDSKVYTNVRTEPYPWESPQWW